MYATYPKNGKRGKKPGKAVKPKDQNLGNPYYRRETMLRTEEEAYAAKTNNFYGKSKSQEKSPIPADGDDGIFVFPRSGL